MSAIITAYIILFILYWITVYFKNKHIKTLEKVIESEKNRANYYKNVYEGTLKQKVKEIACPESKETVE